MMTWPDFLSSFLRFFRSRYVLALEADVERLRTENRALLNKLLVRSGDGPMEGQPEMKKIPPVRRTNLYEMARRLEEEGWEKLRKMTGHSASAGQSWQSGEKLGAHDPGGRT